MMPARHYCALLLCGTCLLMPASEAMANPWLNETGKHKLFISLPFETASRRFDKNEQTTIKSDYSAYGLSIYSESGIAENYNLITSLYTTRASQTSDQGVRAKETKVDISLALRRKLWRGDSWAASADLWLTYAQDNDETLEDKEDKTGMRLAFHAGRSGSLGNINVYDTYSLAFTHYPNDERFDEVRWHLSSGIYPHEDFLVYGGFEHEFSTEGKSLLRHNTIKISLGTHYRVNEKIRLTGDIDRILHARNDRQTTSLRIGIALFL